MPQGLEHQPSTPFVARLLDVGGCLSPVSPEDAASRSQASSFVWLDLENPDDEQLRQFGAALRLDASSVSKLRAAAGRPSFTATGSSVRAVLPGAASQEPGTGAAVYVSAVFTGRVLVTLHAAACPPLGEARDRYASLHDAAKTDGPLVLFLVLDSLVGSFEPQVLALDKRLDEIQVTLLDSSPPGIHGEIIKIRRILAEAVQGLTWYADDLADLAGTVDQLPGSGPGAEAHFDRHQQRVVRMRDAAKDYRDEAKDALGQYSSNISNRQGQLINVLTVVSALFLPLTFITSFFGMNFNVLTMDLRTNLQFILLGVLLPVLSVVTSILVLRRLIRRLGVGIPRHPQA
jgi:Mg2+ and Co2+ transporter CorA